MPLPLQQQASLEDTRPFLHTRALDTGVPGLQLLLSFVSAAQEQVRRCPGVEAHRVPQLPCAGHTASSQASAACTMQELLAAVEDGAWELLAKRRVRHYGYRFVYEVRPTACASRAHNRVGPDCWRPCCAGALQQSAQRSPPCSPRAA